MLRELLGRLPPLLCLAGRHDDERVGTHRIDHHGPEVVMRNVPIPVFECRRCGRTAAPGPVPVEAIEDG